MSCPDWDWASAAILAGICRCATVSPRTAQLASLPKASACLRNSSSAAGTKWFQEKNVSSRFWAWAGARPRASHEAIPAAAPALCPRKRRRVTGGGCVVFMRALLLRIIDSGQNASEATAFISPPRGRIVPPLYRRLRGLSRPAGGGDHNSALLRQG